MPTSPTSQRIVAVRNAMAPFLGFWSDSVWSRRPTDQPIYDFVFGNPHDMPLPDFVGALGRWSTPENKDWYAYKTNEPQSQERIAAELRERIALHWQPDDIFLTNGGFAAIAVALTALVDPGDEVLFISPPWFFYEALIVAAGARPVRVAIDRQTFDLDLDAIAQAITPRTRAILINSPHNPTGKIYSSDTLRQLAALLTDASARHDRPIYLLSDEAYSRIVFDGRDCPSPTMLYTHTCLLYTFGKTLLTPGQRIGYIALPPTMPDRDELRSALFTAQIVTGFAFPNALLQHALPDLQRLSIDVGHLQRKRDLVVTALRDMGYDLHVPDGTFYLMVRSPLPDDRVFMEHLAAHNIYCLPGSVVELPGYFRISLTANDSMIEGALPGFAAARAEVLRSDGVLTGVAARGRTAA
jgi:aspartate aminotransferase